MKAGRDRTGNLLITSLTPIRLSHRGIYTQNDKVISPFYNRPLINDATVFESLLGRKSMLNDCGPHIQSEIFDDTCKSGIIFSFSP